VVGGLFSNANSVFPHPNQASQPAPPSAPAPTSLFSIAGSQAPQLGGSSQVAASLPSTGATAQAAVTASVAGAVAIQTSQSAPIQAPATSLFQPAADYSQYTGGGLFSSISQQGASSHITAPSVFGAPPVQPNLWNPFGGLRPLPGRLSMFEPNFVLPPGSAMRTFHGVPPKSPSDFGYYPTIKQ